MSKVIMADAVSLDGFLADEHDGVGPLHDFYFNGDTPIKGGRDTFYVHFKTSPATARYLDAAWSRIGAMVIGRRLFDITNGWNGVPVAGDRVFVVTHSAPTDWEFYGKAPFTFVTDGVHSAIARPSRLPDPTGTSRSTAATSAAKPSQPAWWTSWTWPWYRWCSAPVSGSSAASLTVRSCSRTRSRS